MSRIIQCLAPFLFLILYLISETDQMNTIKPEVVRYAFGTPPPETITKPTTTTASHNNNVDRPNGVDNSRKVTINPNLIKDIFTTAEPPKKDLDLYNGTTESPKKESTVDMVAWPGAYTPCKMRNNESGICVPYYLCDVCSELVITDGQGILDIRNTRDCPESLLVCCLEKNAQSVNDTKYSTSPPPVIETELREEVYVTDGPTETTATEKKVIKGKMQCGKANTNGISVRINSDLINEKSPSAKYAEFPWMVGILSETSPNWDSSSYLGGGSLLGPRVVLTSAHIVYGPIREKLKLRVRAGEWEVKSESEQFQCIESLVEEDIIHDDYDSGSMHNNIALLILQKPIETDNHIWYACLPAPKSIPPGQPDYCYTTGWGKFTEFSNEYSVILKKIKMPIVPPEPCQKDLRTTYLSSTFMMHHSFICAGGNKNEDSCLGDGGSPLVCPIKGQKNRYAQYGIVSFGFGCGEGHPAVYTNVANFREWIDKEIRDRKIDTTTYAY